MSRSLSKEDGTLVLVDGVLGRGVTRAAFAASFARFTADGSSRDRVSSRGERIGKDRYLVIVRFQKERLAQITLSCDDPTFGAGWDDYDEKRESARRAVHDELLARSLGPAHVVDDAHFYKEWRMPWGSVTSAHDPRGGATDVQIVYAL